MTNLRICYF